MDTYFETRKLRVKERVLGSEARVLREDAGDAGRGWPGRHCSHWRLLPTHSHSTLPSFVFLTLGCP